MKMKNYFLKVLYSKESLLYSLFFLFLGIGGIAQVRVNFTPREPEASPTTSIYHVKGDFSLIGNTNLTLNNYDNNEPNSNNNMIYVDVDSDANTFNSSSSNLTFSTENGAIPECSKIVFAGLYWTGRASNGSNSPDTFSVTKNSITKTFNKRKVQLKGPLSTSYTEVTANTNDIYYPQNNDGFMYSAFAEITDYVKTNGLGQYTVADIALIEGNGGGTGYYGGWGIIVVYENSKMKWRDITVFDGHAYVQGSTTISHQIPISGFNAVQTGQVNVKLGLMAGEGDRSISGDYFNILRSSDNNWQALSHGGNSTGNFFNSSIQTGGNTRNPNLLNNTGLDISMFNIPNPSNSVIANNQTSTTLRYGSTQDTYVIFMAAMAVDAYIPDAEGLMSLITINGQPPSSSLTVLPGEEIEYSIKILNEGTEAINNAQIKIAIPYIANFVNGSQVGTINFSPLPTPNNLYFNPTLGGNGTLIWDIGTLPVPANSSDILGELKYKIKITEDCFLLKNPNCIPVASLHGFINGIGAITGIPIIDKPFIQGYQTSGLCLGDPITDPIKVTIDATDFINQNCQNTVTELSFNYCGSSVVIPFNLIASYYPNGTRFYNSYPVTIASTEYTSSNPFPNTPGGVNYYAVPPNANGCYFMFTIFINDVPIITAPTATTINGCGTSAINPLPFSTTPISITLQDFINAGGTVSNNSLSYNITYSDVATGSCPLLVNRTYSISTSCISLNFTQTFTISDTTAPTFDMVIPADVTAECNAIPTAAVITASDNCDNAVSVVFTETTTAGTCANSYTLTRTWTATDVCGNSVSDSQVITVQDTTAPTFTSELPDDISVSCDAIPEAQTLYAIDSCDNDVTISMTDTINAENSNCAGQYIIIRTWTATDDCNNSTSFSQTITVSDTAAPIIVTPLEAVINVSCSEIPATPIPEFTDNCSGISEVIHTETTNTISIYQYTITHEWVVSDNCGNEATFSQIINVTVEDPFDAIPYAICTEEEPINLFTILDDSIPTNGTWIEITNSGGLAGNIFNPENVQLGYYTLQYIVSQEDSDCPMIYEIYLNVNDDCVVLAACDITVYNAVSPNDDESNEILLIDGIECYPDNTVEIYNRWGILVYDEQGYDNALKSFKGKSEGRNTFNKNELLPDGTYFYILKYTDEENKKHDRSGYLYLNR